MGTTLTLRLPKKQRDALKRRAAALHKTESEIVRELIERETEQSSLRQRIRELVGSLDSTKAVGPPHPLKALIRERNWRK